MVGGAKALTPIQVFIPSDITQQAIELVQSGKTCFLGGSDSCNNTCVQVEVDRSQGGLNGVAWDARHHTFSEKIGSWRRVEVIGMDGVTGVQVNCDGTQATLPFGLVVVKPFGLLDSPHALRAFVVVSFKPDALLVGESSEGPLSLKPYNTVLEECLVHRMKCESVMKAELVVACMPVDMLSISHPSTEQLNVFAIRHCLFSA